MTDQEIKKNKSKRISIEGALTEAWYAAQNYLIGSHEHANRVTVIKALIKRINLE